MILQKVILLTHFTRCGSTNAMGPYYNYTSSRGGRVKLTTTMPLSSLKIAPLTNFQRNENTVNIFEIFSI